MATSGFVAFDQFKALLENSNGKLSGSRTIVAGLGAGAIESVFAVTPFESIKTTLYVFATHLFEPTTRLLITHSIDDQKSAKPRFRGFLHAVPVIARERGIRGFLQGLVPTTLRQSANSAVRFGTYNSLKNFFESRIAPSKKLGSLATFGMGGVAGIVTVYATQPIDTVKTRMQSIEASKTYRNSWHCATTIVGHEGVTKLWSGAVMRLGRLIFSGGIVFTMYEKSMAMFEKFDPEGKFT